MPKRKRPKTGESRAYKYAAYPSKTQQAAYDKQVTGVNRGYNFKVRFLADVNSALRAGHAGKGMLPAKPAVYSDPWTGKIIREQLTFRWDDGVYPMSDVHSVALGAAIGDELRQARKKVTERRARGEKASVRYRKRYADSSLMTAGGTNVPVPAIRSVSGLHARVKLPGAFGGEWKIRYHRELPAGADIASIRVKRGIQGKFEIVITLSTEAYARPAALPGTVAGADRGVNLQVAVSDGRYAITPGLTEAERARYTALEQRLARQRRRAEAEHRERCQVPGCRKKWHPGTRYLRTLGELRELRALAEHRMRDHLHKLTRVMADSYETVVFEDLKLPAMTRSAAGTEEVPGTNVAAKKGLNRELLAANLGAIPVLYAQKGGSAPEVNPAYTSQCCPACGCTERANRASTRFLCVSCGYEADADVNAAVNIRERWRAQQNSGKRSQAGREPELEYKRGDNLIPEAWGRPAARKRGRIRRPRPVK
jgi:transposase